MEFSAQVHDCGGRLLFASAALGLALVSPSARVNPWYVDVSTDGNVGFQTFSQAYDSLSGTPPGSTGAAVSGAVRDCSPQLTRCGNASGSAEASLSEGLLGVAATGSAATLGIAQSSAILSDTLSFRIPGADASSVTPATFRIAVGGPTVHGEDNYLSLSLDSPLLNSPSIENGGAYFLHSVLDDFANPLTVDDTAYALGGGAVGWTSYDVADSTINSVVFAGTIGLLGAAPEVDVTAELYAFAYGGGLADFIDPATLTLTLPEGVTYTSASGVFLTEPYGSSVPEPSSAALFGTAVVALLTLRGLRHRKTTTNAPVP